MSPELKVELHTDGPLFIGFVGDKNNIVCSGARAKSAGDNQHLRFSAGERGDRDLPIEPHEETVPGDF
jgi:hypothetical protein